MKKLISILSALVLSAVAFTAVAGPQAIVVGHANRNINIIDLDTKEVVWQYPLPDIKDEHCNSVTVLADGKHIAFSTQLSVKVVSLKTKELVWEQKINGTTKEFQCHSVVPFKDGGFAVFTAGVPVEVMEVSKDFKITKKTQFTELDGTTNPHAMFRQIAMTKDGNYIVPWWGKGNIYKMSRDGKILDTYHVDKGAFAVRELPNNGNLFFGTGDDSAVMEYDTVNKCVVREIKSASMNGREAWLQYLSQSEEIAKGKYMVANWVGHGKRHEPKRTDFLPVLMIIDGEGNIEWCCTKEDNADLEYVSGFYYSKKPLVK